MRSLSLAGIAAVCGFCVAVIPATAAASDLVAIRIVIRTYDNAALLQDDHDEALAVATAILETAGLDVSWQACGPLSMQYAGHPCAMPLTAQELAIRFVQVPPPRYVDTVALGYSLVDTEKRSGSLATVFVDRVTRIAAAGRLNVGTVLGRAAAHEIGHLLLGTTEHSHWGLMRALWTREILQRNLAEDWVLSIRDRELLQAAVRNRTR